MARSKTLPVPYFTQTTDTNCQGTVLKMMAAFLDAKLNVTGAGGRNATDIKTSINTGPGRPSKLHNAHANMRWWLEQNYPQFTFEYSNTSMEQEAVEKIVRYIDLGYPVLMAVSHAKVEGHIVLVIGYQNFQPNACSADFKLIVHDPYGEFDPTLGSKLYGKQRYDVGSCQAGGGEIGPGSSNKLPPSSLNRHRKGDVAFGTYYTLAASGRK